MRENRDRTLLTWIAPISTALALLVIPPSLARGQKEAVATRQVPASHVLYTVYRGPYKEAGEAVKTLRRLAASQGLKLRDDTVVWVLLNSELKSPEDLLTEVRVAVEGGAVDKSRLQKEAGNLGLGTTGLKEVREAQVMQTTKAKGVADPSRLYERLYARIQSAGYRPAGLPENVFAEASRIPDSAEFQDLEVAIRIPVAKR
jgi:hypothetical protein